MIYFGLAIDTLIRMAACASACAAVFALAPAQGAQSPVPPPVRVTAVLEQEQGVMQGEPIRLRFGFRDTTGTNLFAQTEGDLRWCAFEVRRRGGGDAASGGGEVVAKWSPVRRLRVGGESAPSRLLDLASPKSDTAMLRSDLSQVPPGEYTLRVTTRVKYGPASLARDRNSLNRSATVVTDTFDIPLLIRPMDPAVLRERVGILYRSLLREKDGDKFDALSCELARMPPDLATGAWRSLLLNPKVDRYRFAEALSEVVTKPVVDTLIYVQFTSPIYDDAGRMRNLVNLLHAMEASAGSSEMRQYIRAERVKRKDSVFNGPIHID